jgi:hypothetical protein
MGTGPQVTSGKGILLCHLQSTRCPPTRAPSVGSDALGFTLPISRVFHQTKSSASNISYFVLSTHVLTLSQAITQFILLADASELVPNLTNNRSYSDFHLSRRDWDRLGNIKVVLQVSSVLTYPIWRSHDLG